MGRPYERVVYPGKRARAAVVAFVRYVKLDDEDATDRPPPEADELVDAWLLDLFPGRTLEELDQMDLNRLLRAKQARGMEVLEGRRRLFVQGKLKAEDLSKEEWKRIVAMDAIEAIENSTEAD